MVLDLEDCMGTEFQYGATPTLCTADHLPREPLRKMHIPIQEHKAWCSATLRDAIRVYSLEAC